MRSLWSSGDGHVSLPCTGGAGCPRHAIVPGHQARGGQPSARAASTMTLVTAAGSLIMDRCGALTFVMCAPARWAMATCSAGGMTWSAVPMTSQDEIVCQAGAAVSVSIRMAATGGCCSAASAAPSLAGRPLAKHPGNTLCLTYTSASPAGAPGYGTKFSAVLVRHDPGMAVDR